MNYPLISEYLESIKSAEDNFEELSYLKPVLGDDGLPVMTSGNYAVVFKMKDEQSGKFYAVTILLLSLARTMPPKPSGSPSTRFLRWLSTMRTSCEMLSMPTKYVFHKACENIKVELQRIKS